MYGRQQTQDLSLQESRAVTWAVLSRGPVHWRKQRNGVREKKSVDVEDGGQIPNLESGCSRDETTVTRRGQKGTDNQVRMEIGPERKSPTRNKTTLS